ncbi:uncharacterized protein LOC108681695 [Hyalella azteca]|uniref:Uncharacterized protein LOC108681695 n=1 Tax=Hyalella azteca TaxID=294128 RepID=A0A8B7PJA2_HYAAZ|nr:uncharacterized protein LOC108681695 [Hyalella azteca]
MKTFGATVLLLSVCGHMLPGAEGTFCIFSSAPECRNSNIYSYFSGFGSQSRSGRASVFTTISCIAHQVPKLPSDFDQPLYQYLFETFARNTHLLPLGVPMQSKSEDFETTAKLEKCLWGKIANRAGTDEEKSDNEIGISAETKTEESAYQQIFASRQGGYDTLTGLTLLGSKLIAAIVGYSIFALTSVS